MRKGVLLALAAYLIWGLFPLYWPLAEPAGAVEILAHRMFWSAIVMGIAVTALRQWRQVRGLSARTWGLISLAAVLITINWGVYIYAVNNDHVVEASLGYFINPLVSIVLGVVALRERLNAIQWVALAVAVPGVVLTALGATGVPYLAFALAGSFGLYGLIKRVIRIPAVISLVGESSVLMLPALGYLIWLQVEGGGHFIGYGSGHLIVLIASGLVTATPLLLFGGAARILPLSVLGFLQYINPLVQFLLGVWWAGEHMSASRWAGFAVIWVSLAVLSADAARRSRRRARDARRTRGDTAPGFRRTRPVAGPVAEAASGGPLSKERSEPVTGDTDEPA